MSRAEQPTTTRRSVLSRVVPAVFGLGLVVALTACSAGQITQTDTQRSPVNGASGNVGEIAIRNVQLAYPADTQGVYRPGSTARLILTIINTGQSDDTLERITSPAVTRVLINGSPNGSKSIPSGFSVASGLDVDDDSVSATPSSAPTSPAAPSSVAPPSGSVAPTSGVIPSGPPSTPNGSVPPTPPTSTKPQLPGDVTVDLVGIRSVNGKPLRAGLTIPLTFYFQHAGQVTIAQVPIGAPADSGAGANG